VLRALEQGVVTRVGGAGPIEVDVRVVAATNKELETEIEEGRFREDLFYRLNVVPIHVPPLRQRREDIPMLVRHFAEQMARSDRVAPRSFDEEAMRRLTSLPWPGNVRELRNTVERLMILSSGETVTADDVDLLAAGHGSAAGLGADLLQTETFAEFKDQAEKAYILHKLRENDWNVAETSRQVEMPRSNLYKKIEKYGLVRED
jgi:two-component system nitrogen regulation response regulator NtrX